MVRFGIALKLGRNRVDHGCVLTRIDDYSARDDEFEVAVRPEWIRYLRGKRHTRFEFEFLIVEDELLIYPSAIRTWDSESGGSIITASERDQILADLRTAFAFLGIKYQIAT